LLLALPYLNEDDEMPTLEADAAAAENPAQLKPVGLMTSCDR
jgi:hypothetical protein